MTSKLANKKVLFGCGGAIAVIGLCVVGALAMSLTGGGGSTTTPTTNQPSTNAPAPKDTPKTVPSTPKAWVMVQTFKGNQNTKTPTFQLNDGARIVWTANPTDQYGGYLSVTTYDENGMYGDLVANSTVDKQQGATYNVHGGGRMYLDISAVGVSYTVTVEEYK